MAYDSKDIRDNDLHSAAKKMGMKSVRPSMDKGPFGITHGDPQAKQHTPRAAKPIEDPGLAGLSRQKAAIKKEIGDINEAMKAKKGGRDEG